MYARTPCARTAPHATVCRGVRVCRAWLRLTQLLELSSAELVGCRLAAAAVYRRCTAPPRLFVEHFRDRIEEVPPRQVLAAPPSRQHGRAQIECKPSMCAATWLLFRVLRGPRRACLSKVAARLRAAGSWLRAPWRLPSEHWEIGTVQLSRAQTSPDYRPIGRRSTVES